ncbi:unnamed protein product [Closterium sp. NIES-54]
MLQPQCHGVRAQLTQLPHVDGDGVTRCSWRVVVFASSLERRKRQKGGTASGSNQVGEDIKAKSEPGRSRRASRKNPLRKAWGKSARTGAKDGEPKHLTALEKNLDKEEEREEEHEEGEEGEEGKEGAKRDEKQRADDPDAHIQSMPQKQHDWIFSVGSPNVPSLTSSGLNRPSPALLTLSVAAAAGAAALLLLLHSRLSQTALGCAEERAEEAGEHAGKPADTQEGASMERGVMAADAARDGGIPKRMAGVMARGMAGDVPEGSVGKEPDGGRVVERAEEGKEGSEARMVGVGERVKESGWESVKGEDEPSTEVRAGEMEGSEADGSERSESDEQEWPGPTFEAPQKPGGSERTGKDGQGWLGPTVAGGAESREQVGRRQGGGERREGAEGRGEGGGEFHLVLLVPVCHPPPTCFPIFFCSTHGNRITCCFLLPLFYPSLPRPTAQAISDWSNQIVLQGFNWESHGQPQGWWRHLASLAPAIAAAGFTAVWLPPASSSLAPQGYLPKDLYHLASAYGSEADLRALIAAFRAAQPHTAVPSTSAANGATVAAASSPSAPAAGGAAVTDMNPGIGSNQAAECAPVVTNATGCSGTGSAATGDAGNAGGVRVIADVVVNHRVGLQQGEGGQWTRFDGTSMPWDESAVTCDTGGKGNPSSGNVFEGVSNIDHSQPFVRRDLTAWLTWLQADVGFSGFRFDYAKGYSAAYVRGYVQGAQLRLCVGEYWDTCNYVGAQYDLDYDQDSHRGRIVEWVEGADRLATAFDFTTKAILQEAVKRKEWWRLKDKEGRPPGVMGLVPSHAVTFVDNHDTGSTQAHWPFPSHAIIQGYAYILTHPGIPSVFYDHFFDWGPDLKNQIQQLIDARRRAGIYCSSSIQILAADDSRYAAIVGRNLLSAPPSRMALEIRNIRVSIRCTSVRRRYIGMACSVFLLALLTSGTPPVSAFEHPTGDSYTFSDFHTEQGASNGYTPRELHLGVNSVDVSHPVAAGVDGGTIPVCIARTRLPARPRLRGVSRGFHVLRVTATIPAVGMPRGAFASGPKFEFCVHWNASQPLGDCPRGAWRTADRKGRWVVLRSPFEGAFIDVKQEGGVVGDHDVSIKIDEDLEPHRAVFFVLGFLLMLLAGHLSSMVAFYYGGGMTLGVLLVVIVILYQVCSMCVVCGMWGMCGICDVLSVLSPSERYGGILLWREHDAGSAASGDRHSLPGVWLAAYVVMRLLPLGRKSSLQILLYGSLMGFIGVIITYVTGAVKTVMEPLGLGDDVISPVVVFVLVLVVLIGAALGFWVVRKFILSPTGELDPPTVSFVKWGLRIIAATLLIMSSADAIIASSLLLLSLSTTLLLHLLSPRALALLSPTSTPSATPATSFLARACAHKSEQASEQEGEVGRMGGAFSPPQQYGTPPQGPMGGVGGGQGYVTPSRGVDGSPYTRMGTPFQGPPGTTRYALFVPNFVCVSLALSSESTRKSPLGTPFLFPMLCVCLLLSLLPDSLPSHALPLVLLSSRVLSSSFPPTGTPRTPHPSSPLARAVCPSSFHRTPHRRHLTPAQAAAISHECTQAALQELAYSPGFGQWVLHNFDRIAITPRILREERDEAEIAATAEMEEGFEEEEG